MQRRMSWFVLLMCAVAGSWLAPALADEPSLAEQAKAALDKHRLLSYELPNRPVFQTAEGQQQLALTDEQKSAIRDIGSVFNGKVLDQRQATAHEERQQAEKLSGEAKEKFLKEFWAKEAERVDERRKWAIEARRLVEQTLTEKQLALLRDLEFQQRIPSLIYQTQFFQQLELAPEQQAKMQEIQQAVQKRQQELSLEIMKVQTGGSEKLVELLTPEQRAKLREALDKAYESMLQVR